AALPILGHPRINNYQRNRRSRPSVTTAGIPTGCERPRRRSMSRPAFPSDTPLRSSHQPTKQLHRWSHTDVVGRDVILRASRRDLPRLAFRKSRLQVSEATIDLCIAPLAFDKELRNPALDNHEVDLSTVRVPEVPELEVTT